MDANAGKLLELCLIVVLLGWFVVRELREARGSAVGEGAGSARSRERQSDGRAASGAVVGAPQERDA